MDRRNGVQRDRGNLGFENFGERGIGVPNACFLLGCVSCDFFRWIRVLPTHSKRLRKHLDSCIYVISNKWGRATLCLVSLCVSCMFSAPSSLATGQALASLSDSGGENAAAFGDFWATLGDTEALFTSGAPRAPPMSWVSSSLPTVFKQNKQNTILMFLR